MALAPVIESKYELGGTAFVYTGTFDWDNSYSTGGEAFDVTGNERFDIVLTAAKGGYVGVWDAANQKLLAYYGDNNNASDGPLIQVPDTTDLSAVTGVPFIAIGQ